MVAAFFLLFCSYAAQRLPVMLVIVAITGCSLGNVLPCDIEKTQKRFMTCDGKEYLSTHKYTVPSPVDEQWKDNTASPYSISVEPLRLETLPSSINQHELGSTISLTCISNCYGKTGCPNSTWSFINGTGITALENKYIINETTLTITDFSNSDQNVYVCHIESNEFSIASYPVELKIFNFTGWYRPAYNVPSEIQIGQIIDLTISSSDAVILECSVEGVNLPSLIKWTPIVDSQRQIQLPNGDLLVKEFTETSNTFPCYNLFEGPVSIPQHLIYNVNIVPDQQGKPVMVANPRSQTVISGSNVILYCLIHSNTTVTYHWYHNGVSINESAINSTVFPYVMIITNIPESGSYECMGSNQYGNVSGVAQVTVIAHPAPVISVLSSSVSYRAVHDNADIAINDNATNSDINLVLNCSVKDDAYAHYTWLYKGQYFNSTNYTDGSSHRLVINGSHVDEIIGSVQCLVSVLDVTEIGYLRIIKDKSNPPSDVVVSYSSNPVMFILTWSPPTFANKYSYSLEVSAEGFETIYKTETSETCVVVNMKVEAYAMLGIFFKVYPRLRAIVSTDPITAPSDYIYVLNYEIMNDSPNPAILTNMRSDLINIDQRTHVFNYSLRFDNISTSFHDVPGFKGVFNECDDLEYDGNYNVFYCCSFNDEEKCELSNQSPLSSGTNTTTVQPYCNSTCYWWVGFHHSVDVAANIKSFTTGGLQPNGSGNITSIEWIGNRGTQLQIQIEYPSKDVSCFPTSLSVTCGDDHQYYPQKDPHNATIIFDRSPDSCWDLCSISFTYNNSIGTSPRSIGTRLPPPNDDNIGGYHNIVYQALTKDYKVVNISWTLAEGMECLIEKGYIQNVVFSFGMEGHLDCSKDIQWSGSFSPMNLTSTDMILNESVALVNGKEVCIKIGFTLINGQRSPKYFYTNMNPIVISDGGTTDPGTTPHSSGTIQPGLSNLNQISTELFLKTSLPVIGVVLILVIVVLVVVAWFVRKYKNKRNDSRLNEDHQLLLSPPDGSDNKDDDTGTVVTKYEELESSKKETLQSYLRDVEAEAAMMAAGKGDHDTPNKEVPHPLMHKEEIVVVAEVNIDSNHKDRKRKKKKDRARSKKKKEASFATASIPSSSLLKGSDCETLQNASQSVFSLVEDSWSDYQSHPLVGGAGLNQTSQPLSLTPTHNEKHELKEINKSGYEDMTTPTQEDKLLGTPIHDPPNTCSALTKLQPNLPMLTTSPLGKLTFTTPTHDIRTQPESKPYRCNMSLPCALSITPPHSNMTTPLDRIPHDGDMTPLCGNIKGHHYGNMTPPSITDPLPPPLIPTHLNKKSNNDHMVGSSCNWHPSATGKTLSSLRTNPEYNKQSHHTARPNSIPLFSRTTTRPDYSFQIFQSPRVPPPSVDPPRTPSRMSSGLGSPTRSTGSCDSVFDNSDNQSSAYSTRGSALIRHHSDATSGIESPGPLSPQVSTGFDFNQFNRRLSMEENTEYISDISLISQNHTSPVIVTPTQQRTLAELQYPLPRPSQLSLIDAPYQQQHQFNRQTKPSSQITRPHPLTTLSLSSSDYIQDSAVSDNYRLHPHTTSLVSNKAVPVSSSKTVPSHISLDLSPTSPCNYVLPSLLYTCNSETTTPTSVVAMETFISNGADRSSSESSFSESYSIESNSSSLDDFIQNRGKDNG